MCAGRCCKRFLKFTPKDRPEIRPGLERLIQSQRAERAALYRKFVASWNKLQKQGFKREFLQMLVQTEPAPNAEELTTEESVPHP